MLTGLTVIILAGLGGLAAGYVLWWSAHRSGLWNMAAGVFLGLAAFLLAVLIGYVMIAGTR
jgi:hypothetical protein